MTVYYTAMTAMDNQQVHPSAMVLGQNTMVKIPMGQNAGGQNTADKIPRTKYRSTEYRRS